LPSGLHGGYNQSFGTFGMFTVDANYQIQQPTSQFFASQLITQEWAQPGSGAHRVFPAASDVVDGADHTLVTAYALSRPDATWSLLVVNKDQHNPHKVKIRFQKGHEGIESAFTGAVTTLTFGSAQYRWHAKGSAGFADPNSPPVRTTMTAGDDTVFELPAASISVIRGSLAPSRSR
jgi:hypothetical protein